jgi:hypothetical protein
MASASDGWPQFIKTFDEWRERKAREGGLIVSERIFRDVICGGDTYELPPAGFRETEIVMADKGLRAQAFIYTGQIADTGQATEPAAAQAAPEPASPQAQPTTSGGASFTFGGRTSVGDIAGRGIIKNAPGTPTVRSAERTRDE